MLQKKTLLKLVNVTGESSHKDLELLFPHSSIIITCHSSIHHMVCKQNIHIHDVRHIHIHGRHVQDHSRKRHTKHQHQHQHQHQLQVQLQAQHQRTSFHSILYIHHIRILYILDHIHHIRHNQDYDHIHHIHHIRGVQDHNHRLSTKHQHQQRHQR